jgi:hypothetical protein
VETISSVMLEQYPNLFLVGLGPNVHPFFEVLSLSGVQEASEEKINGLDLFRQRNFAQSEKMCALAEYTK